MRGFSFSLLLLLFLGFVFAFFCSPIVCYPNRAEVCDINSPAVYTDPRTEHPTARTTTAPFSIQLPASYTPGDTIQVSIGRNGNGWKGLLLYTEDIAGNRIGTFSAVGAGYRIKACLDNNAGTVEHSNANTKTSGTFTWTAPAANAGSLTWKAIVLQSESTWYKITNTLISTQGTLPPPTAPPPSADGTFRYSSSNGLFSTAWKVDTAANTVTFTITGKTTGWISWGVCKSNLMANCDYAMGYIDNAGTVVLRDTLSTSYNAPSNDGQQDFTIIQSGCTQDATSTTIQYSRKLNTGDTANDYIIENKLQWFQWAIASTDTLTAKHSNYGTVQLNLLATGSGPVTDPPTTPTTPGATLPPVTGNPNNGGNAVYQDPKGQFVLSWKADQTTKRITITMTSPHSGWIGAGICSGLSMSDCDYWVGWVDSSGQGYLYDTYSNSYDPCPPDESASGKNDLTLISASEVSGVTSITFSRALVTNDPNDKPINDATLNVQWAYANGDGTPSSTTSFAYGKHAEYGFASINFITGSAASADEPESLDAGAYHSILISSLFIAYFCIRHIHKIRKYCTRKINGFEIMAKDGRVDDHAFSKRQDAFSNINPASSQPNTNRIGISVDPIRDIEMKRIADDGSWNSKDHRNGSTRNRGIAAAVLNDTSKAVLVWKAEWLELKADDGTPYYYNQRLKETAWEIPPMPDYFALPPPPPNGPIGITLSKPPPYLPNDAQTRNRLKSQSRAGKLAPKDGSSSSRVGGEVSIISSITRTFLHARVPFSQQSIMDWIVFLVYASINLLAIYALDTSINNAKKWGYSTAANLMIVTLPATRNSLLYYLFGFPFDRLIVFHRWIGRWTFLNMIIHLALYVKRWNEAGLNSMKMLKTPEYMHGLVAFIFTGALMITAYEEIRRRFFNLFYYSHFLFIFIYIFSYLHVPDAFTPYIICIGVFYGFDRVLRLIWGLYITKTIQIRQKADDIIQVRFKKHCLAKYFYRIGQYIFISFPELSVYAFHPFTLSSSPDELSAEVHIRSLGDYTNKLRDRVAKGGSSLYIRTDGPYGNHRFTYRRFPGLILIGGGIGVTPLIAILRDIYRVGDFPPNDNPPAHVIQHVCCVWIVPSIKSFEWFREEITEVYNKINRLKGIYPELSFFVYCSRESDETLQPYRSNSNGTSFVAGRPDMDVLFSDVNQRINGRPVSVFACGPKLMTSAAWDATSTMRLQGFYFNFHHETFDW